MGGKRVGGKGKERVIYIYRERERERDRERDRHADRQTDRQREM